ncbi:OmpA family protein [Spirosoma arcticum]
MAVHLLTLLKEQFTPGVIDLLSRELNESPVNTLKAVNGSLPTLLGGLTRRVQASGGASSIIGLLEKGDYSSTPLDVSQVVDEHQQTVDTVTAGRGFLGEVFGDKLSGTTELIGAYSGTKPQSTLTILGLAGSVLMGVLGRQQQENGLTAHNLSTLLLGQATEFRNAVPGGLDGVGNLLGFDDLQTPAGPQTEVQGADNFSGTIINPNIPKSAEGDRRQENVRWLRWAMVAMGILVAALIVQKCSENQNSNDGISTDSTARVESNEVEDTSAATKQSIRDANGQVADSTAPGALGIRDSSQTSRSETGSQTDAPTVRTQVELPGGRKLSLTENSFNAQLARFLGSKPKNPERTFTFDNLTFETNSARITAQSQPNVNDLIEIMKAYPGLNIRVEGHTDNTGSADANRTLSLDRASAVKSALTAAGVQSDRITTQGFGSTKPIASNDSDAGRQKNRRIDVAVTKV